MTAGLIAFPVIFLLAVTGIVYLFKDLYEAPGQVNIKQVARQETALSFQRQWEIAKKQWERPVQKMVVPEDEGQATEFVSGRHSGKSSFFINPYTGEPTGNITVNESDMYTVRKLHGELLTGRFGTTIVELVASWLIVLIISGLILFFPRRLSDCVKLFRIRWRGTRDVLYRDLHQVGGFWFSLLLLLILAGGMPWTNVWGEGFKWVQKQTGTGYPVTWQGRGLKSTGPTALQQPMSLDSVVAFAKSQALPGEISLSMPQGPAGIYSIHNVYFPDQSKQVAIHLNQYSGDEIARLQWSDVGLLMRGRMWAMAFHQGQFGLWNWLLVLVTALGLLMLSTSAVLAFFFRKRSSSPAAPQPSGGPMKRSFYLGIGVLGVFLPLFGASVLVLWIVSALRTRS